MQPYREPGRALEQKRPRRRLSRFTRFGLALLIAIFGFVFIIVVLATTMLFR